MAGILPSNGVGPAQTQGGLVAPDLAAGCPNLYYPPRCNPRMDPFAMNSLISEIIDGLNALGEVYDCNDTSNLRDMLLKIVEGQYVYDVSGGTANARTMTLSPEISAYLAGLHVIMRSSVTNTGAMTLNINGLGPKAIVTPSGNPMANGDVPNGTLLPLIYDGVNFVAYTKSTVVIPTIPDSIGVNQAWVNLVGSRALNTPYQNTVGRAIEISAMCSDDSVLSVSSDSQVTWIEVAWSQAFGMTMDAIIPAGHWYRMQGSSIQRWAELR